MTCNNCSPDKPGKLVKMKYTAHGKVCAKCGDSLENIHQEYYKEKIKRWDIYFHTICGVIAFKSPCLSRQIGAILVRDKSIVSTGYNGPARNYPHCVGVKSLMPDCSTDNEKHYSYICPRHAKGYKSGEGLNECPAAHAEANCITNAARIGASTIGTTLYMNYILPCKDCAIILVNAGIIEIVVDNNTPCHEMSIDIFKQGDVKTRKFIL